MVVENSLYIAGLGEGVIVTKLTFCRDPDP